MYVSFAHAITGNSGAYLVISCCVVIFCICVCYAYHRLCVLSLINNYISKKTSYLGMLYYLQLFVVEMTLKKIKRNQVIY